MLATLITCFLILADAGHAPRLPPNAAAGAIHTLPFRKRLIDKLPEGHYAGLADLDRDGDLDLLATQITGDVWWYRNGGGGRAFAPRARLAFVPGAGEVHGVDLDHDQDLDLVVAAVQNGTLVWLENQGLPSFTPHVIATGFGWTENAIPVDLDGDGDLDVVGFSWVGNTVAWWENDGAQHFAFHAIASLGTPHGIGRAVDLDRDGDLDLVVPGGISTAGQMAWLENDGAEHFTPHLVEQPNGFHAAEVVDLDQDGDLDLVGAEFSDLAGGGSLKWFENLGAQVFVVHHIDPNLPLAATVCVGDFDLDGQLDVMAGGFAEELHWYRNLGGVPLAFERSLLDRSFPLDGTLLPHDFDGDGDLDVYGLSTAGEVTLWENRMR
jgi:hypothetical protein